MLNWENGASVSTVRKELKGSEEQQNLLALIEYGFTSGQPGDVLASIHLLMDMEDKPEQFIPLVKEALKPESPETCFSAFFLLLDYGVEHLPPLRE